jgi:DNA-binding transcriptional LysR family regulator
MPCARVGCGKCCRDFEPEPYGVHALYPHSRHLAAKVRVLVDFLAERYRGTPPWDVGW